MAIPYINISQPDPQNRDQMIRYPRAVASGVIDTEDIIEELEMTSTLSGADILGVIYGLTSIILRGLSNGKIIRIGNLGSLRITFETKAYSNGNETPETAITKVNAVFSPGKRIKQMLNTVSFTKKKARV